MCLFKQKKQKPEPELPTREDQAIKAEDDVRRRLSGRQGRNATVLTTPLGVSNFGQANRGRATVLGV